MRACAALLIAALILPALTFNALAQTPLMGSPTTPPPRGGGSIFNNPVGIGTGKEIGPAMRSAKPLPNLRLQRCERVNTMDDRLDRDKFLECASKTMPASRFERFSECFQTGLSLDIQGCYYKSSGRKSSSAPKEEN